MLEAVKMLLLVGIGIGCLLLLVKFIKGKSPKKVFLWSCLSGVAALFVLGVVGENLLSPLPLNPYTLGTATVLGIPGVILLTLIKIIWQL